MAKNTSGDDPLDLAFCGDVALDVVVTLKERTQRGSEAYAKDLRITLGGSAIHAYAATVRHEVKATIVSTLGDDEAGLLLNQRAESRNIDMQWVAMRDEFHTHICVVEVIGDERSITGRPPQPFALEPPPLPPAACFVLFGYWFLRYDQNLLFEAFAEQSRRGAKIILDIPPGIPSTTWKRWVDEGLVDALVCTPSRIPVDHDGRPFVAEQVPTRSGVAVLCHDGYDPVKLITSSRTLTRKIPRMRQPSNITGAGDALTAGFAVARVLDLSIEDQLHCAVQEAAAHIRRGGAT